ncbi:MAG: ATP-binding cassette domain-containing protein [Candidatus Electryoneaceae bacterium]|nr:ATP-binding cassette domain-containing protein [Candidatus Electryoneaceae bacterium]
MNNQTEKISPAKVVGLTAAYGEHVVLDGVTLEVDHGEIIAIIGGSGSGKTTLLKHFIGLLQPVEGTIELFGQSWWALDEPEREGLMRRVGVLFQNGALLGSKTLETNVAIPLEQHTKLPESVIQRIVRMKLRQVGLEDAMDRMPAELSGGMRKRAALARALALDPDMLFCDEPSAGLDPSTSYHLYQLLLDLRSELGLTIVVVTHEIASIKRIADRIAYLEKGQLIFIGTLPEALSTDMKSVRSFFEIGSEKI